MHNSLLPLQFYYVIHIPITTHKVRERGEKQGECCKKKTKQKNLNKTQNWKRGRSGEN